MILVVLLAAALGCSLVGFALGALWARRSGHREVSVLLKRLQRAESSRSEIIVELAHDLRTPLTSILTLFESIQGSRDPEYVRQGIALALPEVEYVNQLIADLFLLAQVQEPTYKAKEENVNVAALFREEIEQASVLGAGRGIRFRFEENPSVPAVVLDSFLLRRLAKNLLSNAGKFAKAEVVMRLEALGTQSIRISVIDDGPGFNADDDPLGERRPCLEGKTAGSSSLGLGSVIVRRIAQIHGGYLRTFNRANRAGGIKGAVVEVTLTCRPAKKVKAA
jgi:signal transduction histidine kinase